VPPAVGARLTGFKTRRRECAESRRVQNRSYRRFSRHVPIANRSISGRLIGMRM
jgi:hypothetical protein